MKLTATDDQPGYVVPEFRVDGDGWENYYGWPTNANAPFHFSVTGTDIDSLNYGKLAYGHHVIEYRAIDAAGNIAAAKRFEVTYLDPQASDIGTAAARCRRRWRSRSARRRASGRSCRASRRTTTASMSADVITTAGNAALSVADPSPTATGHLVNGAFSLPQALLVNASSPLGTGGALRAARRRS